MQIKAGSTLYPWPTKPLTLGEQRRVKREYGFVPGRDDFDLNDPDHVSAFLYGAIRQAEPDAPASQIIAVINDLSSIDIVDDDGKPLGEEAEVKTDAADPSSAAEGGEKAKAGK